MPKHMVSKPEKTRSSRSVWVLNWRFELEVQSNQTEEVFTQLFETRKDAVAYAVSVLKRSLMQFSRYGYAEYDMAEETTELRNALAVPWQHGKSLHLCQLTDSDDMVFELSRHTIHGSSTVTRR